MKGNGGRHDRPDRAAIDSIWEYKWSAYFLIGSKSSYVEASTNSPTTERKGVKHNLLSIR